MRNQFFGFTLIFSLYRQRTAPVHQMSDVSAEVREFVENFTHSAMLSDIKRNLDLNISLPDQQDNKRQRVNSRLTPNHSVFSLNDPPQPNNNNLPSSEHHSNPENRLESAGSPKVVQSPLVSAEPRIIGPQLPDVLNMPRAVTADGPPLPGLLKRVASKPTFEILALNGGGLKN